MLTTETQQGFGLKSKDMKMQTPSNERRISQKSNHTAVLVHIPMFWNRSEKKKIKNQRKISMGDLFKDIQPVYLIDSLLNLFKKRSDAADERQCHREIQSPHFLCLCLLPFSSDVAFHDCLETKDIYKKNITRFLI